MATGLRQPTIDRVTSFETVERIGPNGPLKPIEGTFIRRPILVPRENGTGSGGWLDNRLADLLMGDSMDAVDAVRIARETEAILASRGIGILDTDDMLELGNRLRAVRDLSEIHVVVDELLANPVAPAQPRETGPFGPIVTTLFEIFEAVGISNPGLEMIWRGLTEIAVTETASVIQAEIPGMVNALADVMELSSLQRQQIGQTMRADLMANEFYADTSAQLAGAVERFAQERGNDGLDLADQLNAALYEGFLRATETGNGERTGIPFGPGLEGLEGIVIPEGEYVYVKVGGFDLFKNLQAGTDRQPPVHLIEQRGFISDELSAVANTYPILQTVELYANEIRRRDDVNARYPEPGLMDPIPTKYFVKVPPGLSIETHNLKLKSDSAIGRTDQEELERRIQEGTERLKEQAPDWKEKANSAVNRMFEGVAPGLGSLGAFIVEPLIDAAGDFALDLAVNAGGRGISFPEIALVHVTVYPKKRQAGTAGAAGQASPPLNMVAVVQITKQRREYQGMRLIPEIREAAPIPFTRISGPKDDPVYDDRVGYKLERVLRWWVGASAPPESFERDYNNLTKPNPKGGGENFKAAPRAIVWREPMKVTDDAVAETLKKDGVVIEKRATGERYAYRGFGGIIRLDIGKESSAWVALRAETYLVPADAGFLPDPTSPGTPG